MDLLGRYEKRSTYLDYKSYLKKYFLFLYKKGLISKELFNEFLKYRFKNTDTISIYRKKFFKDFDSFFDYIEEKIDLINEKSDSSEYDIIRTIFYLTWFGFNIDDLSDLEKTDVKLNKVYNKRLDEWIIIDSKVALYLHRLANEDTYVSIRYNKEVTIKRCPSKKMLRSYKNGFMDQTSIKNAIKRFRTLTDLKGSLSIEDIYSNGLFIKMHNYENKNGKLTSKKAHDIFGFTLYKGNTSFHCREMKRYRTWKEAFGIE